MNHCVPDFEIEMDDDEYPTIPLSSGFPRPKKPFEADDGIMELFWQNGPVVRKPPPARQTGDAGPSHQVENYEHQHLFMQEDEMTSWLHYPIVDDSPLDHDFSADLIYSPPTTINNSNQIDNSTMQTQVRTSQMTELRQPSRSAAPRPPIPPTRRPEQFSKRNARVETGPSSSRTVVDSCETPAAEAPTEPTEGHAYGGNVSTTGLAAPSTTTTAGGETGKMESEMTATSSPGGSSGSAGPAQPSPAEDRKRKGREADDSECHSEDVDYESAEAKKQVRRSTSTKRSRAAEVHNLSERRRRDRINEKMRALQELIPRCNKSDKASMLDEAIEYLKSLQLQVQMMSMGCGMVPMNMMYAGMQQYMGMGMGMEMGMNRAVMSYPNMIAAASGAAAAHLGPRFSVPPPFHELSRMQAPNQSDTIMPTPISTSDPTHSRIPNLTTDPFHQFLGPHQMQLQFMQSQAMYQQNVSKPSTSKGHENPERHQSENR